VTEPIRRPCKACGRELVFATGPGGKAIPLSRVANVYVIAADGSAEAVMVGEEKWISHFVDCSDPARFSKGKRTPS